MLGEKAPIYMLRRSKAPKAANLALQTYEKNQSTFVMPPHGR